MIAAEGRHPYDPCPGRMAFVDRASARRHAQRASSTYRCRKCALFHLGKVPAANRGAVEARAGGRNCKGGAVTDLFRYPGAPGAQDRDTSHEAATAAADTAPRLRARALAVLERSNGLTADEVAGRLGLSILSIRPRVTELARLGKVRDSGARRHNKSGRRAIVWAAVFPNRLKGQKR